MSKRAKVKSPPRSPHRHPLEDQIGTVLQEGKEGENVPVIDPKTGKPTGGKVYKKYPLGDRRRNFVLQFGYSSIREVDLNNVFPIEGLR